MVKFDIDKKGYDVEQVERYINNLSVKYEEKLAEQKDRLFTMRNELNMMKSRLEVYQNKDKQISQALVFAVEKAGQIENSARKLYDLEIKRINILYEHWKVMLGEVERVCGGKIRDERLLELIDEFKVGLDSVMEQNETISKSNIKQELKTNSDNYIKNLLNKMDYVINNKSKKKPTEPKKKLEETVVEKPNIGSRLQFISSQLDGKSADKYLNDEKELKKTAFASNFMKKSKYPKPNESGFDLEDALNPKEDLDEIMKAFDFFIPENAKKKVN
jgi:hypothetical protein